MEQKIILTVDVPTLHAIQQGLVALKITVDKTLEAINAQLLALNDASQKGK